MTNLNFLEILFKLKNKCKFLKNFPNSVQKNPNKLFTLAVTCVSVKVTVSYGQPKKECSIAHQIHC